MDTVSDLISVNQFAFVENQRYPIGSDRLLQSLCQQVSVKVTVDDAFHLLIAQLKVMGVRAMRMGRS